MPEGHTLYRLAREQSALFAGRPVHVTSPQGRFDGGAALLDGRVLDEVFSYGKHLFARFGSDHLHVHLGLYGAFGYDLAFQFEPIERHIDRDPDDSASHCTAIAARRAYERAGFEQTDTFTTIMF